MKDSGVDWLGDVPHHWNVFRFKQSTTSCQNGLWGADPNGIDDIECVRVADFDRPALKVTPNIPTLRAITQKERAGRLLERGNLLIEKSGGGENQPVGQVVLYDRDVSAICSNFVAKIELAPNMDSRFWNYQHHAAYAARVNVKSIKQTSGIQNLDQHQYLNELATFPPTKEQAEVADFLDRATIRIDGLVAKKTRFLGLLREKRQALITHAVTKGLDRGAPMKDSSVAWLGNVPAHWDVGATRRFYSFNPSKREISTRARSEEVSFLPMEAIGETGALDLTRTRQIKEVETGYSYFANGDVVVAKITPCFENGKGAAVDSLVGGVGFGTTELIVLRPSPFVTQQYSWWLFSATGFRRFAEGHMEGSAGQKRVQDDWLKAQRVAIPPRPEQEAIVAHLERATARIDTLIAKTERSIKLLREHRTALITAAVTGKIDLRPAA